MKTDKVPYRDPQENVIGVLVFAQDITERKRAETALQESERQYRLLMEEASDGIAVLDLDGYFRMVNSKVCKMLGYTREELLQLHLRDTYFREHACLATPRTNPRPKPGRCTMLQRKDGTVIRRNQCRKMDDDRYFEIIRDSRQNWVNSKLKISDLHPTAPRGQSQYFQALAVRLTQGLNQARDHARGQGTRCTVEEGVIK